ncbi:MAG: UbiA family prenyltransferase [Pseudomonadota bacterium]
MTLAIALRLGRVSNLPTVWTNTLVGAVIAGAAPGEGRVMLLMLVLSVFYVAGMYLNDAFDREIDARERPERPIPSGQVRAATVFWAGFAMLGLGLVLLAFLGFALADGSGWLPVVAGLALAGVIVYYDVHHKGNPLSPLWMGVCRMLVYLTTACALTPDPPLFLFGSALLLLAYLIGLSYVAKQENLGEVRNLWPLLFLAAPLAYGAYVGTSYPAAGLLFMGFLAWTWFALSYLWRRRPGDVPRAVASLIAGISLLDALIIADAGAPGIAWLAVAGFALTLALQRVVPAT